MRNPESISSVLGAKIFVVLGIGELSPAPVRIDGRQFSFSKIESLSRAIVFSGVTTFSTHTASSLLVQTFCDDSLSNGSWILERIS